MLWQFVKMHVKYIIFFLQATFFIKICWKYRIFLFYRLLFLLRFVGNVFFDSKILSHLITESPVIVAKYLWFSQLHVAGFQIYVFRTCAFFLDFSTHIDIYRYSTFDLNWIFYHQVYIYIHLICALFIFLTHLCL